MNKCAYCGKSFHIDRYYMKKQIDMLTQIMDKHNISLTEGTKKNQGGPIFEDNERVHSLVTNIVRSPSFIIDFGASSNMVSTREAFSSLDDLKFPMLLLGDNS